MTPNEIIPDRELSNVFTGTDFGSRSNRSIVNESLLKVACGYRNGSTASMVLNKLDLVAYNSLTTRGRKYLWSVYGEGDA